MASESSATTESRHLPSILPKVPAPVAGCWDSSEQVPAFAGFCGPSNPADGEKRGFDSRRFRVRKDAAVSAKNVSSLTQPGAELSSCLQCGGPRFGTAGMRIRL